MVQRIGQDIKKLTAYGLQTGLIEKEDKIYTINRLLELLNWTNWRMRTKKFPWKQRN